MIIVGIDDLAECLEISRQVGIWHAWKDSYFAKYESVFSPMLKHLYHCEVDDLKGTVEAFDFTKALDAANKFLLAGGIGLTEGLIAESEKRCAFDRDFDVYLLIGLGGVDGTSLPGEQPFLYFGLERYESEARTTVLVPHEYNHVVRVWSVYRGSRDDTSFTLGDAVISEGLAVVFSEMIASEHVGAMNPLMMPPSDISYCEAHRDELIDEVLLRWNDLFTRENADLYLNGKPAWKDGRPSRIGYYVGAEMVKSALTWAYGIGELTKMSAERIRQIYRE